MTRATCGSSCSLPCAGRSTACPPPSGTSGRGTSAHVGTIVRDPEHVLLVAGGARPGASAAPAVATTFARSAWHLAQTSGGGSGFSWGLWQPKQLVFACPSGPLPITCVTSVVWHFAHDVRVSSGRGACGLWHEVQSLWRSGASATCFPFVSEWHFRQTAPVGGGPWMSWQFVHALCCSGLRVRMSCASSLWHCMHPLRSARHVCGTWQLAQLLCFSAVVFSGPSEVSPFAFFSWQLTHVSQRASRAGRAACGTRRTCGAPPAPSCPPPSSGSSRTGGTSRTPAAPAEASSFLPCALWQSWHATPPCSAWSFTSFIGRELGAARRREESGAIGVALLAGHRRRRLHVLLPRRQRSGRTGTSPRPSVVGLWSVSSLWHFVQILSGAEVAWVPVGVAREAVDVLEPPVRPVPLRLVDQTPLGRSLLVAARARSSRLLAVRGDVLCLEERLPRRASAPSRAGSRGTTGTPRSRDRSRPNLPCERSVRRGRVVAGARAERGFMLDAPLGPHESEDGGGAERPREDPRPSPTPIAVAAPVGFAGGRTRLMAHRACDAGAGMAFSMRVARRRPASARAT